GAAGVAIAKMLIEAGIGDVAVADRKGVVSRDRDDLTPIKAEVASFTNKTGISGTLEAALEGADVFIGVSGGTVAEPAVASMAKGAFVFAMANPNPEVHPEVAHKYAAVVATGRSDFPNQINNVLAFPGIFAGALQVRASRITEGMKLAAAEALASVVGDDLAADYVIPSPFDERVAPAVTAAVAAAARAEGVARRGRRRRGSSPHGPAPSPVDGADALAPRFSGRCCAGRVVSGGDRWLGWCRGRPVALGRGCGCGGRPWSVSGRAGPRPAVPVGATGRVSQRGAVPSVRRGT